MLIAAWVLIAIILSVIMYFAITTIVDIILMGKLKFRFGRKPVPKEFMISNENRIDIQGGFQCSAFSSAYVLRGFGFNVSGEDVYKTMPNKMNSGYVYPKGIVSLMRRYKLNCEYFSGNLNSLKSELSKGKFLIVMIKVYKDKNWLHYVPVVGYDEEHIFIAESLPELINCNGDGYNRVAENGEFKKLWNTSMLRQPFYRNTYFLISKN